MKIDMSPEAVTKRLRLVNELRKVCLSLANSSAGREVMKKNPKNKIVQRTAQALGRK
ncbi:MAG TPA: hypothetical protein PLJ49_04375 [Smithella sp.]|jgi:hypothetical protein|nr:hypothetical protein [Smithella sp.]HOG08894.1 hypothetical protein [Smithella sp.]HOS14248.1 hypothetical protein [Smithella sp.]HOX98416.1 hypothetical protein [Smithella sp.]HPL46653.1 hypothetical protein [Smithella sp.]